MLIVYSHDVRARAIPRELYRNDLGYVPIVR